MVALPDMARALNASLTDLQWVIDVYALALAALLLGMGAAADVLGRRRVHVAGIVLFAVASLAVRAGTAPGMLVATRGRAGHGRGGDVRHHAAAARLRLPGAATRSVALGVWGAVSGAAAALGPVVGGLLTEGPGWRWIFFVNLPVSVAAVWLTLRLVPESRAPRGPAGRLGGYGDLRGVRRGADVRGGAGRVARLGRDAHARLRSRLAVVALAGVPGRRTARRGPAAGSAAVRASPRSSGVMAGALAFNAAAFGVLAYTSIWLQTVLGMSPVRGGLVFLCRWPLAAFVVAAVGGPAAARGAGPVSPSGAGCC